MKEKKKIAVLSSLTWDGGIDFVAYLAEALVFQKKEVELLLVMPYDSISILKSFILKKLPQLLKKPAQLFAGDLFSDNPNKKVIQAFDNLHISYKKIYFNYSNSDLKNKLKKAEAEVLFPVFKPVEGSAAPAIGYIPDLQHKYFPHFFSEEENKKRDALFCHLISRSKAVIVNSSTVKKDLQRFYQVTGTNIFSLPFCPPPPKNYGQLLSKTEVEKKFGLTSDYFIISNQFWKHKSHDVAFAAYAKFLKEQNNKHVMLACTGKMEDPRLPEYISELKKFLQDHQLESSVRLLGFTSKTDQLSLLFHSLALIQPTLFEGGPGGGAAYNAVSYGVPCILSDIEINKEIHYEKATFFVAGNSDDLALKMKTMVENKKDSKASLDELTAAGHERILQLQNCLFSIFDQVR